MTKSQRFVDHCVSRRQLLKLMLACCSLPLIGSACARHRYRRPAAELDLGVLAELLYERVHIRSKSVLLFRDIDGWYALSTRCTYEGCDLTFNEPVTDPPYLLCSCCRSLYQLNGKLMGDGPAKDLLPWIDVYYRDGHLYANPGQVRAASWRFMTPEIKQAEEILRKRVKPEELEDEIRVPKILQSGEREPGPMFLDEDPTLVDQLKMIK